MANDYTAKFRVDISDLKKNISEAQKQIKLANATFKAETAGMEDWTKDADGLSKKLGQLKGVLSNQKTILSSYREQLERQQKAYDESGARVDELKTKLRQLAENGVDKASQEYKDYQTELRNAMKAQENSGKAIDDLKIKVQNQRAAVGKTEADIKKFTKAEEDLGNESEETAKDINKVDNSLEKVGKQSDITGGKIGALGKTFAKGLTAAVGAAAAAVGAGVAAMAKATQDAGKYADEINTLSQTTHMSTEELQEYKYAAELVDVSLDTLTGSMAKNVKSMANAQAGSAKYADAYKKLGVSVTDAHGNLRDGETVYWEAIDALGKIQNETERDAIAMQLFGKSARDLNPLINKGSKGIKALREEARRMGVVMSKDSLNALGEFDDTLQRLKGGASAAKNAIGLILLPQLKSLAGDGVKFLESFTGKLQEANGDWNKIGDVIGDGVKQISDVILEKLPTVLNIGADIIGNLGASILEALPTLSETAVDVVGQLAQFVVEAAPNVLSAGAEVVKNLVTGIKDNLKPLLETLTSEGTIKDIISTMIDLFSFVAQNAGDIIGPIVSAIPTMIAEVVKALTDPENVQSMIDGFFGMIGGILESAGDFAVKFVEALPDIIDDILDPKDGLLSKDNIEKFIKGGIDLVKKIVENIDKIIAALLEAIPGICESIVSGFGGLVNDFFNLGIDTGNAFIDGIASVAIAGLRVLPGYGTMADTLEREIHRITGRNGRSSSGWLGGFISDTAQQYYGAQRRHADGGVFTSPQWGMIGEDGAEAVVPLEKHTEWINKVANQLYKKLGGVSGVRGMANSMIPANASSMGGIHFTQINNSPKALSRIEIYRQTKNILSLAKEVV